ERGGVTHPEPEEHAAGERDRAEDEDHGTPAPQPPRGGVRTDAFAQDPAPARDVGRGLVRAARAGPRLDRADPGREELGGQADAGAREAAEQAAAAQSP